MRTLEAAEGEGHVALDTVCGRLLSCLCVFIAEKQQSAVSKLSTGVLLIMLCCIFCFCLVFTFFVFCSIN